LTNQTGRAISTDAGHAGEFTVQTTTLSLQLPLLLLLLFLIVPRPVKILALASLFVFSFCDEARLLPSIRQLSRRPT
jgi:hypothetical protein